MADKQSAIRFLKGALCGAALCSAVFCGRAAFFTEEKTPENMTVGEKAALIASMLESNYIEDFDENGLADKMYSGMADSVGDPYTVYLSAEEMTAFMDEAGGTVTGIGIVMSKDENGNCVVSDIINGSPAESSGLKVGDIITSIDGESVVGLSVPEVSALTKGKSDTYIRIGILRDSEPLVFDIKRSTVELNYVEHRKDGNIGYIKITEFTKNAAGQFKNAVKELTAQGIDGIVLDLRDNPGGIIDSAAEIGDLLLPECVITYTVDKNGGRTDFTSDSEYCSLPLAVLVNGGSASASELLAGAIQDNGRGIIIGEQTYGKGIVQGLYGFNDGSGIKITIQRYFTPNGVCIHGEGITPDIVVHTDVKDASGDDTQYEKAVETLGV